MKFVNEICKELLAQLEELREQNSSLRTDNALLNQLLTNVLITCHYILSQSPFVYANPAGPVLGHGQAVNQPNAAQGNGQVNGHGQAVNQPNAAQDNGQVNGHGQAVNQPHAAQGNGHDELA